MDPAPPESCQSAQYQSDVATTRNNLGNLLSAMGQYEEAKALYAQALAMRETLLASDRDNAQYRSDVATTRNNLGNLLSAMGRLEEAKVLFERARIKRETLLASDKDNAQYPFFGDSIKG